MAKKVLWLTHGQMCKVMEWSLQQLPQWSSVPPHEAADFVAELQNSAAGIDRMYSEMEADQLVFIACESFVEGSEEAGYSDVGG